MESKKSPVKVFFSGRIKKDIKKLSKRYDSIEKDIEPFIRQLEAGEIIGDKISGNKYPVFKARIKNSDIKRGKSGGYRAIYYIITSEAILLVTIYSKSDRDNISNEEIEEIIEQYESEVDR